MAVNPSFIFALGIVTIIIAILIFYYFARVNQNVADVYRRTVCSGIL